MEDGKPHFNLQVPRDNVEEGCTIPSLCFKIKTSKCKLHGTSSMSKTCLFYSFVVHVSLGLDLSSVSLYNLFEMGHFCLCGSVFYEEVIKMIE